LWPALGLTSLQLLLTSLKKVTSPLCCSQYFKPYITSCSFVGVFRRHDIVYSCWLYINCAKLQFNIDSLVSWAENLELLFNIHKCYSMKYTHRISPTNFKYRTGVSLLCNDMAITTYVYSSGFKIPRYLFVKNRQYFKVCGWLI